MPLVMSSTNTNPSKPLDPDDLFAIFDAAPGPDSSGGPAAAPRDGKKGHAHRNTRSLVGFDPMLEIDEKEKASHHSSSGSKVWSNADASVLNDEHPLLADGTLSSLHKTSSRSSSAKRPPSFASHKSSKSVCVSDLQDIASQLSFQRPRAMTSDEERRITLGDSTSDSVSKQDRKLLKKKSHRKSQSLSEIIGLVPKKTSPPPTPATRGKPLVKQALQQPTNTPPRSTTSTPISSPKTLLPRRASTKTTTVPTKSDMNIPTLMKQSPTSFLKDNETAPRSSEQDPSPHQVAIPTATDLHTHAKLCELLERYREIDQNFDFNTLQGVDSLTLKGFTTLNHAIPGMTAEQKPIVQAMLDCHTDLMVEGHVCLENGLEVGVFSMQNTYVAAYKGTPEQQAKPGRNLTKEVPVALDAEHSVMVYPPFRQAYFELEKQVYTLLDSLLEANPFSDVIFVGHSFGGALATMGAVRFASARPSVRFSCHTFGAPKVGAHDFCQFVHTLPNLKVVRVELPGDSNTTHPADHGTVKYQHAGHSLVLSNNNKVLAYRFDAKKPSSTSTAMSNLLRMAKPDIHTYVKALEPFTACSDKQHEWVSLYVGQNVGKGVRGKNNEKRLMV